jgi:hypothetical protein
MVRAHHRQDVSPRQLGDFLAALIADRFLVLMAQDKDFSPRRFSTS